MKTALVLTVIGEDRPGLVKLLSQTVSKFGGNWEESRMSRLAGRFAGILRVSVDAEQVNHLERGIGALDAEGLKVVIERSVDHDELEGYRHLELELVGNDRPGIIHEVSRALAERGINVEELHTECDSAPMAGGVLFRMEAYLRSPPDLAIDELRAILEELADDLMVDVALADTGM